MNARLWTSGYDMYTPWPQILIHDYNKKSLKLDEKLQKEMKISSNVPSFFNHINKYKKEKAKAIAKLKRLFLYNDTIRAVNITSNNTTDNKYQYKYGSPLKWHDNDVNLGIYSMGTIRSYDKFINFTKINTKKVSNQL